MLIICVSLRISIQHSPQYVYLANSHNGNWVASSVLVLPPPQNQTARQPATHFPTTRRQPYSFIFSLARLRQRENEKFIFKLFWDCKKRWKSTNNNNNNYYDKGESSGRWGRQGHLSTWSYNSWMRPTATDLVHNITDSWWSFSCSDSPPPPAFKWAQ